MDDEDDTASIPVETLLISVLSKVQQTSEQVNKTCEDTINRLRGSMGIRMPGVKRVLDMNLNKMIDDLTNIKKFLEAKTSYTRNQPSSIKLSLPELTKKKDPRRE